MVSLNQVRVGWTGVQGMPGVSTFYSVGDPSFLLGKLSTFFNAIRGIVAPGITWTFPTSGNVIDSGTGLAISGWTASATAPITTTATGAYSAPAGAVIHWKTGLFLNGRELRGKTFIVPLVGGAYGSDGKILPANVTTLQSAASAVPGGGNPLHVYGRRSASNAPVTSATVPSKIVVMRSRRD